MVASGVGRLASVPEPAAAWIRKKCPGAMDAVGRAKVFQLVPAALAYWTERPDVEMALAVGL